MSIKCICTNCAGHLEFEEGNEGTTIPCPHCGFKTTLALPGSEQSEAEASAPSTRRLLLWSAAITGVLVLLLGGFVYALYHWGVPWLTDTFPSITSPVMAWAIALLACLAAPFLLFWLIFPVFVFMELRCLNVSIRHLVERVGAEEPAFEEEADESQPEEEIASVAEPQEENPSTG